MAPVKKMLLRRAARAEAWAKAQAAAERAEVRRQELVAERLAEKRRLCEEAVRSGTHPVVSRYALLAERQRRARIKHWTSAKIKSERPEEAPEEEKEEMQAHLRALEVRLGAAPQSLCDPVEVRAMLAMGMRHAIERLELFEVVVQYRHERILTEQCLSPSAEDLERETAARVKLRAEVDARAAELSSLDLVKKRDAEREARLAAMNHADQLAALLEEVHEWLELKNQAAADAAIDVDIAAVFDSEDEELFA